MRISHQRPAANTAARGSPNRPATPRNWSTVKPQASGMRLQNNLRNRLKRPERVAQALMTMRNSPREKQPMSQTMDSGIPNRRSGRGASDRTAAPRLAVIMKSRAWRSVSVNCSPRPLRNAAKSPENPASATATSAIPDRASRPSRSRSSV